MATYTSSKVASGVQPRSNIELTEVHATYTVSTALALNDVIQMVKIPANATIIGLTLSCGDLDTDGSPAIVLDVGDGSDTDRFIDGSTIGQAGGVERINAAAGHNYTYSAEDTIDVLVQVGPATGATAVDIDLTVLYTLAQ